jgi:hypothetical protein
MGNNLPTLMSNITILRVVCIVFMVLFSTQSIAEDTNPPYKSKTADECIYEKECFWHHFLLGMQKAPIYQVASKDAVLKRWEKPIRLRVMGTLDKETIRLADKYINQIVPFIVGRDIFLNKKYNHLILFTDDIERVLSGEFDSMFKKMYKKNVPLDGYRELTDIHQKECYYNNALKLRPRLNIYVQFSFIQEPNTNIKKCLRDAVYASTGMESVSYSPLLQEHKSSEVYTKLEQLLVFMLYQDQFIGGMTADQAKIVFDKIYEPFITSAVKQGVIDANR